MSNRIIVSPNPIPRLTGDEAIAYAAGLFDGEGCISILRQKKRQTRHGYIMRLSVTLAQNHLQTLADFTDLVGIPGRLYTIPRARTKSNRDTYALNYTGEPMERLLRKLQPFLHRKRDEVDLAFKFIQEGQINRHFGPHGVPADIWRLRVTLANKMSKLK